MQQIINHFLNILQKKWHAIGFTLTGLYIIGGAFHSLRLYIPFLMGFILVWLIPVVTHFFQKISALILGVILLGAQGYYYQQQPILEVKTLPIVTYHQKFLAQYNQVPPVILDQLLTRFKKDIDLSEKIPSITFDGCISSYITPQFFLNDFKYTYPWLTFSNTWCIPVNCMEALNYQVPVVVAISVKNAKNSHFWRQGVFYVADKQGNVEAVNGDGKRYFLKDYQDTTLFFPFINDKDQHWLYMETWGYGVFLPFVLFLLACLLCDWQLLKVNPKKPLVHMLAFGIAFVTTLISLMLPYWHVALPIDILNANIHFYKTLHESMGEGFFQHFLWFVVNKVLLWVSDVTVFVPLLCLYFANLVFLKFLKKLFNEKTAYITWAVMIGLPWLALYHVGLDVYRHLYVIHSSLMLGFPLFCFGFLGFFDRFRTVHAISWVLASLCHPVLGSLICVLFLYKHLPKQRYIYFSVTVALYLMSFYYRGLTTIDFENPLMLFLYNAMHSITNKDVSQQIITYLVRAYNFYFLALVLIPNILVALRDDSLTWKRLGRVALIMHGIWLFDGTVAVDVWIASTLSAVTAIHFYQPIYNQLIVRYEKFTTTSKLSLS